MNKKILFAGILAMSLLGGAANAMDMDGDDTPQEPTLIERLSKKWDDFKYEHEWVGTIADNKAELAAKPVIGAANFYRLMKLDSTDAKEIKRAAMIALVASGGFGAWNGCWKNEPVKKFLLGQTLGIENDKYFQFRAEAFLKNLTIENGEALLALRMVLNADKIADYNRKNPKNLTTAKKILLTALGVSKLGGAVTSLLSLRYEMADNDTGKVDSPENKLHRANIITNNLCSAVFIPMAIYEWHIISQAIEGAKA
jgi:hypothetical protein